MRITESVPVEQCDNVRARFALCKFLGGGGCMDRQRVVSSSIRSVGYDATETTLEVEFVGGDLYQYFNVPVEKYERLMAAASKGRYLDGNIKDRYRYRRIR